MAVKPVSGLSYLERSAGLGVFVAEVRFVSQRGEWGKGSESPCFWPKKSVILNQRECCIKVGNQ